MVYQIECSESEGGGKTGKSTELACPGAPLWQAYIDDADFHLTLFDTFLVLLLSVSLKPILFYKKEGKMNIINV